MRRKRATLGTLCLLALLVGGAVLGLYALQRQYTLNRRLITALADNDTRQALVLVSEGADPNTQFLPSVSSWEDLVKQLFHRSSPVVNNSPTAFQMACGARENNQRATIERQLHGSDDASLIQAMLAHGAQVNRKGKGGMTPLLWATLAHRSHTVGLLLAHGAQVNAQRSDGLTALQVALLWHAKDKALIRQLLAHGADPDLADRFGVTPLAYASGVTPFHKLQANPDLVVLLKQAGARK